MYCGDVLEHIEPDCIDDVLDDIKRVTQKVAIFVVSTQESKKTLPDGRNAHLLIKPVSWWMERLERRFYVKYIENIKNKAFVAIVFSETDARRDS